MPDGHQTVGLAPGLREPSLQKFIEGLQFFHPPVLARPHLTEIPALTAVAAPHLASNRRSKARISSIWSEPEADCLGLSQRHRRISERKFVNQPCHLLLHEASAWFRLNHFPAKVRDNSWCKDLCTRAFAPEWAQFSSS